MSDVIERKRKREIFEKIEQYGYDSAMLECAFFKENLKSPYWNIYILKIILQQNNASSPLSRLVERPDFAVFRAHWTIRDLDKLLEKIAVLREMAIRDGRHPPEEQCVFDICGYTVKVYGNYPGEFHFVGSYTINRYYALRFDRPYHLLEYAIALLPDSLRHTQISGLEHHDPPFSSPAQAVNHYFGMILDPFPKDFRHAWAGILFPTLDGRILKCTVSKTRLTVEVEKTTDDLTLSVIGQGRGGGRFNQRARVTDHELKFSLGFQPETIELNLFRQEMKLDYWHWTPSRPSRQSNRASLSGFNDEGQQDALIPLLDMLRLHPKIVRVSRKAFGSGLYAEAILNAFKEVITTVRNVSGLKDRDGKTLMDHAFTPNNPKIKLNKLVTISEKDEQLGFMHIFGGVALGIRNPKAHDNVKQTDPLKTLQYLCLASLLLRKIDERVK